MKIITTIFSLFLTAFTLGQTAHIEIEIKGVSNTKGNVSVALYNNAKDFTKKEIKSTKVNAKKGKVYASFKNLPAGTYGVAVLHDENINNKMDFSLIGTPKEDFGFSNNPKVILSAPSFEDVAFKLKDRETKKVAIKLK